MASKLKVEYEKFCESQSDLETYLNRQIIYLNPIRSTGKYRIVNTTILLKPVIFLHRMVHYKRNTKLLYGAVDFDLIKSNEPIKIVDLELLPKLLGYNFSLDDCSEKGLSVEYYKLKPKKSRDRFYLIGHNSNSVPGKCVKWQRKLRIGILNSSYYWLASQNLIAKQLYCDRSECLMSFNQPFLINRHNNSCNNNQKINIKQKSYGNYSSELDWLIEKGYLTEDYRNFRATQMCVFDIECLESKVHTASPEYGNVTLASQVICSIGRCVWYNDFINVTNAFIGVASNIGDCKEAFFVRESSSPDHGQKMVDNFMDHLEKLLQVI